MSGTRTLSAMTLFFFVWMTLYPAMAAAVAAVPAPSVTPAVAQPAPDTLESLRGLSQHAHAKTEAGEDSGTEVKQLLQHAAQLDGEQQRAEAGFAADRQHLEERHLPDIIRERHAQALADYRANMQQLRQQLTDFKAAHDRKDAAAARRHLKSLAQFLDNAQKHRQHLPFDADNLPSVIPNRKTRAPKTSRRDLDGILHPPKPVAVAANELTPGMLATDDPGPTPTATDLAATEDAPLSTAVKAQAAALHNNPVAIYNWVRNTVEFQPTYGGIQNADQTLQTRRGNAADTASLLVALLRAANIPARYAYGTVQIPAAQVMNWVGSVGTPEAAQSLLNQGGIPNSAVVSGGVITAFKLEHVWVEAFVDYFPSRGAVNKVGDTWVPLDASFKQRGDQNGLDLTAAVPLNAQAVTDTAKAAAQCGADSAQALDSAPVADAFADYSLRLNRYLAAQSPDLSLTDILGTHTITAARYPILLGSLPYATVSQATVTATYPDSLRWRLRYAVYASELERGQNRPALILDNSLAALGGQRVTLSFTPATAADQSALDSFMPAPHPDGSPIEAAEFPAGLPGYLIHVRAELKVGGTTVASGGDFQLGQPLLGSLGHFDPAAAVWHDRPHALSAGEYHALAIDGAGIAAAQLDALAQTAAATVDKAGQGDFSAADRDSLVGGYLHQAVLADFALADAHNALAADAAAIAAVPLPSYGRAALQLAPTLLFGSVRQARFLGTALHADRRAASLAPKTATSLPLPAYQRQSLQRASADSQQILQRLLTDSQRPGESVSAVKALATAIRQGIPLLGLDSTNAAAQLPQLGLDDSTKTDLANAVNSGFQALAQQTPVTLGGYVGGGYRLDNPQTGAGAYRLSTEQAGGADGLLFGNAGLGYLSMASAQQAAATATPALQAAHDLDSQLAALLPDRTGASQLRWSTYPAQSGIVSALFLTQLANQPYRDACDQATAFLAADLAAAAGLPANAANHPLAIISAPLTATAANQPYRYPVQATDSDGDPLSYRLSAAPGGMTVGSDGLLAWDNPVPGNYPIRLRVDDGQAYTEQTYTLSVGAAPATPNVQVSVSPAVANPGDSILVNITVLGGDLSQASLSVDGVAQALDSKGQARLSAAASGTHLLVASLGGVSQQSQYSVRAPGDSTALVQSEGGMLLDYSNGEPWNPKHF
ncbi:transglutaminase-like domain-containing protein [Methylovulum psychrotolerans]|uniref:Transglutaminase-like domain-containing protein n=1 Tax=Methylovulum psychrotolerans TaxID=1704499 RepID=A0A1Z4C4B8_9GAMM|nr:transglutaminase-like domain-containing protein [Methylovulum psychrotolerans]ASF48324.1 hypothetical protein CEK71_20910 [Methylovulum psychrotolerans]